MARNFLTIDDIAETLGITRQTVSKYIREKELNAVKINKSYRVPFRDFELFLSRNATISEVKVDFRRSRNCQLDYAGRTDESEILSGYSAGVLQEVDIQHDQPWNQFIFGDNYLILKKLLPDLKEKVDLVYIDPPFGTGQDFINRDNDLAYSDSLVNQEFLEFMRKRLYLMRECLSPRGSIYLHIDKKIGHYVKVIMDEVFGYDNFINDITRIKCNPKNFARNAYGNYSDMILFYARNRDENIFAGIRQPLSEREVEKLFPKKHPKQGRYTTNPLHAPGETVDGDTGKPWKGLNPPKGRHWRYSRKVLTDLDRDGLVEWSDTGNPRKIVFARDHKGKKIQDVWEFKDKGLSYVSYPTQKNHEMLRQIILNSSVANSLVMDCFAGSGGTLQMAHRLGRRWIGMDNSLKSLDAVKKAFAKAGISCNYYNFVGLD